MFKTKLQVVQTGELPRLAEGVLYRSELSYLLYQADPLNTCCRENDDMANEYSQISDWIAETLAEGSPLTAAVSSTLADLFDADDVARAIPVIVDLLQGPQASAILALRQTNIDALHLKLFPECYDYLYDSIEDARIRRRGVDPMSDAYQMTWQEKRRERGLSEEMHSQDTNDYTLYCYANGQWSQVISKKPATESANSNC